MSAPKRASMREGPLAALFRKTEELEGAEGAAQPPEARDDNPASRPRPAEAPAAEAATDDVGSSVRGKSAREAPHPSLRAPSDQEDAQPRVPSPQERLRNVFSSEIPESASPPAGGRIVERPGVAAPSGDRYAIEGTRPDRRSDSETPVAEHYGGRYAQTADRARPFGQALPPAQPVIRVVGVGGGGTNAVNRMVEAEVEGVEFLAVNTDLQSLQQSTADITMHIGAELTRGLGSGSDANVGRQAAMDDYDRVKSLLKGSDMIFIAAGAGGGTGTGAAPIVARIAREVGALTVAIVTKPFGFEGARRATSAEQGIEALAEEVDTLIVVPNDRLLGVLDKQTAMVEAFRVADDVLRQGVQGISDLVTLPGLINLDFADVRTIMSDAGNALLGIGMGVGENRAVEASMQAVASPLLDTSMDGARSILLSITGGPDLSLWEVNEAAKAVSEAAHPDANIIFGAMVDDKLDDQVWVTVVATGYGAAAAKGARPQLREPAGEPRVKRTGGERRSPAQRERDREARETRRGGLVVSDRDVPEFIPNF